MNPAHWTPAHWHAIGILLVIACLLVTIFWRARDDDQDWW